MIFENLMIIRYLSLKMHPIFLLQFIYSRKPLYRYARDYGPDLAEYITLCIYVQLYKEYNYLIKHYTVF